MRKISLLFGCLLCMLAATAQIRGNEIRVMVSPDHTDWNYRLNDKCTFTVRYGAQNEVYMSQSAGKWVRGLCFNELGVCS